MADSGSKTEKATPKKRKDERKRGNFFSSRDIVNVAGILAIFFALKILFPRAYEEITAFLQKYINYAATTDTLTTTGAGMIFRDSAVLFAMTALPLLLLSVLITIVATGAQTRFMFAGESLKPKFNRLNPLQGLKKMVSLRSAVEVVKGILKIAVISVVIYKFISDRLVSYARTAYMDLTQGLTYVLDSVVSMVFNVSLIFVFIALLDYLYQRWDYERQIKMTKQEVKEEYKQLEGDPQVKGRIRDIQRKFAMSRMMQEVPTADVIIRNPTHFAVALKYDMERNNAPIVVAKGQDHLALRIIALAEENGVYITEDPPLARALYATVNLGAEIPADYYNAVAEVLALLYRMRDDKRSREGNRKW